MEALHGGLGDRRLLDGECARLPSLALEHASCAAAGMLFTGDAFRPAHRHFDFRASCRQSRFSSSVGGARRQAPCPATALLFGTSSDSYATPTPDVCTVPTCLFSGWLQLISPDTVPQLQNIPGKVVCTDRNPSSFLTLMSRLSHFQRPKFNTIPSRHPQPSGRSRLPASFQPACARHLRHYSWMPMAIENGARKRTRCD